MPTDLRSGDRVLVRLPSWLGDAVMAEPALAALGERVARGGGRLSLAGPPALVDLLGPGQDSGPGGVRSLPIAHRGAERPADWRGHDVAVLLTGSLRSAWVAWRAGVARRVGWARDARGWLLTDPVRPPREVGGTPLGLGRHGRGPRWLPRPFGASCAELVGRLGVEVARARPRLAVGGGARAAAEGRLAALGLAPGEPFLLLNAGGRPGSAKAAPEVLWAAVLEELAREPGLPVVAVCGPGEEQRLDALAAAGAAVRAARDPVPDLAELAALCSAARLVLTADSGPRHVAAAVGADLVCLIGPTDPRHTADHLERTRLVRRTVPCGPCHRERCPLSGAERLACWQLDVARVAFAARSLLG